ncbi:MAG: hypothetical protein EXQ61_05405 [Ilumatobacteraceae bacterium]|nr:hypothetical protein [Ilumatobacteraceae bacterium]
MPYVDTHQVESPDMSMTTRRRLIASLLAGGAVVAAAPLFAGHASAAEADAPPPRDAADNEGLNVCLERESRMVTTYRNALTGLTGNDLTAMSLILDHHVAYAQALKGYLAVEVGKPSSAPLASPSGSLASIARQLAALEDQTASIHTDTLATINGLDAATLLASIVTVEARHAAALLLIAGASPIAAVGN